ncbi:MAG: ATP-binding protein [Verrucomicrobiia bacterium]
MKTNPGSNKADLRRRAETRLIKHPTDTALPESDVDPQRLLHELQVHQVELEMQNEELQAARNQAEEVLEKYTDLYDFAPVGYFSVDEQGLILEVNLTAAAMLGVERARLVNRRFRNFVAPSSRPMFLGFLQRALATSGKQTCEMSLVNDAGEAFWAGIQATPAVVTRGARRWCRIAVSDISALKRAEEAQRRMDALTVANEKLQREIGRRREAETALKKSEKRQSQLLEEARHMQDQLRHLSHQVLQAQEEERKRISRDLHDQVAQALVGINVHLTALTQQQTVNRKQLNQEIASTLRLVEESVDTVHRFARELRPTLLDDLGLIPALYSFMKDFTKRTGIRTSLTSFTSAKITELDGATSTVLYRVALEALTNVARHAEASQVKVAVKRMRASIRLEVTDDGKGFDVERVLFGEKQKRLGVLGMRERVQMVGGRCSVDSQPGKGTTVCALVPLRGRHALGRRQDR